MVVRAVEPSGGRDVIPGAGWLRHNLGRLTVDWIGAVTHVATDEPAVALTFDDGPNPRFTPRLLEILERHQARATFFMVGIAAARYPELVREVAQAGHAIGNHSWDHASFPLLPRRERIRQLSATAAALAPHGQRLFRPPYGHLDFVSVLTARLAGQDVVTWNAQVEDWLDRDAAALSEQLLARMQPGNIVLMHDAVHTFTEERYVSREPILAALDQALTKVADQRRFVTVPELMRLGRPLREHWRSQPDPAHLNRLQAAYGSPRRYV